MTGRDSRFLRGKQRPQYENGTDKVRVVDLFSGCGGLSLGVAEACHYLGRGFELRLAMEQNEAVRCVFDSNFNSIVGRNRGDVLSRFNRSVGEPLSLQERQTAAEVGPVDVLVGGPPCQGHSDLNNHSRRNDPKNQLYLVMVRATEVLRPEVLIIENVTGVKNDKSSVLERAINGLKSLNYAVKDRMIALTQLGVPQRRVRHVLFASRNDPGDLEKAIMTSRVRVPRTLRWAIADLSNKESTSDLDSPSLLSIDNLNRACYLQTTGEYDLPNSLRPACHRDNPEHRYTAMYGRLKWNEPAHTITTGFGSPGQGRYLHPSELRTLTPHEAARLQFFPDWFDFSAAPHRSVLAHCIGNAVPSKLPFVLTTHWLRSRPANSQQTTSRVAG